MIKRILNWFLTGIYNDLIITLAIATVIVGTGHYSIGFSYKEIIAFFIILSALFIVSLKTFRLVVELFRGVTGKGWFLGYDNPDKWERWT